jgi:hypothetical protein
MGRVGVEKLALRQACKRQEERSVGGRGARGRQAKAASDAQDDELPAYPTSSGQDQEIGARAGGGTRYIHGWLGLLSSRNVVASQDPARWCFANRGEL